MTSKRRINRVQRRKQCGDKKRLGKDEAQNLARKMRGEQVWRAGHITAYRCPYCSSWHVGHTPDKKKRPFERRRGKNL